jgi:hypothetical protein
MSPSVFSGLYPPTADYHQYFNDLIACSTAGCNAPAADACALATAPVLATLIFTRLPASAQNNATGRLSASGLAAVQAAATAGVLASACTTCHVNVSRVLDLGTGAVTVYAAAPRRLSLGELGPLAITFALTGSSNATLAAAAGAVSSPIFGAAAAASLAATPDFAGVAFAPVAPFATCKGATLPPALSPPSLACYTGQVISTNPIANTLVPGSAPPGSSFGICAAATVKCASALAAARFPAVCQGAPTAALRIYFGAATSQDIAATLSPLGAADVSACTTPMCNAPSSDACAVPAVTCKGAAPPASLAAKSLTCYTGIVTSTGSSLTSLQPESGFGLCVAATSRCSSAPMADLPICKGTPNVTIRAYLGLPDSMAMPVLYASGATDIFGCTTPLCNAPTSDTCAITAPGYASILCPTSGAVSTSVSAAPIACFSNVVGVGAPVLQTAAPTLQAAAVPGSAFCVSTTVNCAGATAPRLKAACGNSNAGFVRVYAGASALVPPFLR